MRNFLADLRYELRALARTPGFTLVVVLTLAFGIGSNVALFSFADTILLRPLPFRDASRITMIWTSLPELGFPKLLTSPADYSDLAASQQSFESLAIFENHFFDLTGNGRPERITGAKVSASLFPLLGVAPLSGRVFTAVEDQLNQHVVVLSHGLWQRRYAGDQNIVGKSIFLDRQPYTVVGVMPRSFLFPISGPGSNDDPADIWVPVGLRPEQIMNRGAMYEFSLLGKLKPRTPIAQAQSEAKVIGEQVRKNYPPAVLTALHNSSIGFAVVPYHDEIAGDMRGPLLVLQGAVTLLLLIAFANTANLLLVRGAIRQREMAIRASLGAGWWQTTRLVLAEGFLLAFLGGGMGAALVWSCRSMLVSLLPASFPQIGVIEMNGAVLSFVLLLCVIASVVFGLVSAIATSRHSSLQPTLQGGGRSASGTRRHRRLQGFLVVSQCAIALTLLIGAGLLLRSFSRLLATDPGFQSASVLRMSIYLPREAYAQPRDIRAFFRQVLEHAQTIPGARIAALGTDLPLDAQETELVHDVAGFRGKADSLPTVRRTWILGDYLKALGVPLIEGRVFTPADNQSAMPVVLISKDLAQKLWPDESAVGKHLRAGPSPDLTVIGTVGDVKDKSLANEATPHIYTPYLQETDEMIGHPTWNALRAMNLVLQTGTPPSTLIKPVEAAIWELDPQLAITHVETLSQDIRASVAPERFNMFLLLTIACLAVFLAIIGIYGVVSYIVAQRTQEIGVRMALGATPRSILLMVLRQGLALAILGSVIGVGGAWTLSRFLQSLLYGVTQTDALTFSAATGLLLVVTLIACYLPARSAMQVEPSMALRHQ